MPTPANVTAPARVQQSEGQTGFDAMGREVPTTRRFNADRAFLDMVPNATAEQRFSCIQRVSTRLERDDPYGALEIAREYLDLTGAYRLLATLLT